MVFKVPYDPNHSEVLGFYKVPHSLLVPCHSNTEGFDPAPPPFFGLNRKHGCLRGHCNTNCSSAVFSGKEHSGFRVSELQTQTFFCLRGSMATEVCVFIEFARSLLKLQSLGPKFSIYSKEACKAQPMAKQTFQDNPANVLLPGSFLMTKVMCSNRPNPYS